MDPAVILAYAIFDAENTTRLGEYPEAFDEHVARGRKLLAALINYRPQAERQCVADAIYNKSC